MTRLDIQGAGGASELPGKGSLASKRIDAAHVPYGSSDDSTGDPSDTGRNSMENDSAQVIAQLHHFLLAVAPNPSEFECEEFVPQEFPHHVRACRCLPPVDYPAIWMSVVYLLWDVFLVF